MQTLALEPQAAAAHLAALDRLTKPLHGSSTAPANLGPSSENPSLYPSQHDPQDLKAACAWPARILRRAETKLAVYVEGGTAQGMSQMPNAWASASMVPEEQLGKGHPAGHAEGAADRQSLVCSLFVAGEVWSSADRLQHDSISAGVTDELLTYPYMCQTFLSAEAPVVQQQPGACFWWMHMT